MRIDRFAYLLDTNIVSDLIRHPAGKITQKIRVVGEDRICTNIIVAAELRYGARKKGSPKLTHQVETVLTALTVLPLSVPSDERYAELRTALEQMGRPIGPNDMLIAAHALALGFTLVTDNVNEFSRVNGLSIQNWLNNEIS